MEDLKKVESDILNKEVSEVIKRIKEELLTRYKIQNIDEYANHLKDTYISLNNSKTFKEIMSLDKNKKLLKEYNCNNLLDMILYKQGYSLYETDLIKLVIDVEKLNSILKYKEKYTDKDIIISFRLDGFLGTLLAGYLTNYENSSNNNNDLKVHCGVNTIYYDENGFFVIEYNSGEEPQIYVLPLELPNNQTRYDNAIKESKVKQSSSFN